jgi:hypothetical protein
MLPRARGRVRLWWPLLTAILLAQIGHGFATDLTFSGTLERVGEDSLSVKLADRRVVDARLPHKPLPTQGVAQYKVGDSVQITCKRIQPVWEEGLSRYQYLEVTTLRLLRRLSPEESAAFVPDRSLNAGQSAGKSSDGAADAKLAHARSVNLEYVSNLPNFVADETAKRYTSSGKTPDWRYVDTIETEVTFQGNRVTRQQIRRDGSRWEEPFEKLPGFKWYGGFGTEIKPLFDPQCPTTVEYISSSETSEQRLLDYRFRSPADGCFGSFYFEYQRYNPARTGHVFIADPAGAVLRLEEEAGPFPAGFEFAQREERVEWRDVNIGGTSHVLPVRASFVVLYSSGVKWRVEVEYKNHRHFEASTDLKFH